MKLIGKLNTQSLSTTLPHKWTPGIHASSTLAVNTGAPKANIVVCLM